MSEGAKEDKASWTNFLRELKQRGLKGVQLFVSDKRLSLVKKKVFLSYSQKDKAQAMAFEGAMIDIGLSVFRDERSISPGDRWAKAIEEGILASRGVVVFVTAESASSHWVTYEYAFATGAGIPVVAVVTPKALVPSPIQAFQIIKFTDAKQAAERVKLGVHGQVRKAGHARALEVTLAAKFQEQDGNIRRVEGDKLPGLCMDLWIEHAPPATRYVHFEIPDFHEHAGKWRMRRSKNADPFREFLTDMNSYGDVEIWASGVVSTGKNWTSLSTLYEALDRYYKRHLSSPEIRRGLAQIRRN